MATSKTEDVLDAIYNAAFDDAAFHRLPDILARDLNGRSVSLQLRDRAFGLNDMAANYFNQAIFDTYVTHFQADDPWISIGKRVVGNRMFSTGQHLSLGDYKMSRMFNDLFRANGDDTAHCLGGRIESSDGFLIIGVHRGLAAGDFGPDEVARAQAYAPHLGRLHSLRLRLRATEERESVLKGTLDKLAFAAIVVTADRRVVVANAAAETLLRAQTAFRAVRGVFAAVDDPSHAVLTAAIGKATARRLPQGDAFMVHGADALSYRAVISPVSGSKALILIDNPQHPHAQPHILRAMYSLSESETQLAVALINGQTLDAFAEQRGVKMSTARSQLSSLLLKTGTTRQPELVARLASLPPLNSPGEG